MNYFPGTRVTPYQDVNQAFSGSCLRNSVGPRDLPFLLNNLSIHLRTFTHQLRMSDTP